MIEMLIKNKICNNTFEGTNLKGKDIQFTSYPFGWNASNLIEEEGFVTYMVSCITVESPFANSVGISPSVYSTFNGNS